MYKIEEWKYGVWEIISYAWTEIGIEQDECDLLTKKYGLETIPIEEIEFVIKDVCASFATDSFLIFPMMLWMLMPDWGFNEDYLRNRANQWYQKKYWMHFMNPLRIAGYLISLYFATSYIKMLRKSHIKLLREKDIKIDMQDNC